METILPFCNIKHNDKISISSETRIDRSQVFFGLTSTITALPETFMQIELTSNLSIRDFFFRSTVTGAGSDLWMRGGNSEVLLAESEIPGARLYDYNFVVFTQRLFALQYKVGTTQIRSLVGSFHVGK